jgi:hypothetical protein
VPFLDVRAATTRVAATTVGGTTTLQAYVNGSLELSAVSTFTPTAGTIGLRLGLVSTPGIEEGPFHVNFDNVLLLDP